MMVTGCGSYGAEAFHCENNLQCSGGTCELSYGSLCSFPVSIDVCPSGRQFSDHAGTQSGKCVGSPPIDSGTNPPPDARPDAPPDAPPDARVCFGTAPFDICLASAPTVPLTISTPTKIDTTSSSMCVATTSGGANYCVVAATTISITAKLRGIGTKPLVLLASDSITISTTTGLIDVGNHRGDPDLGAGADPSTCMAGTAPGTRAGGAGGSFTGRGGGGGNAAGSGGGIGGRAANGTTTITELRGGCAGQNGNGSAPGTGGRGGGAVYLLAGNTIDITTSANPNSGINAAGEGGGQGAPDAANTASSGGGGGGAGGMILFDAPAITCDGLILANGGGGGEGSGETAQGNPGADPADTDPAVGGSGNPIGGNGGAGSSAVAAGIGTDGSNGNSNAGDDGAGGGGGGAAGLVKAPAGTNLGGLVSPPAT